MKFPFMLFILICAYSVAQSQIVNIESARLNEDKQGLQALGDLRFNIVKNQNKLLQLNNKLRLQYTNKKHRCLVLSDINLFLTNDTNYDQNAFQHLRYGYMIDSAFIFEGFLQNQYDRIQLIKSRRLLGLGGRFRFLQRGIVDCHVGLSYMFEHERELNTEIVHQNHRFSSYLNFVFTFSDQFKYHNTTYYQPRIDFFGDFRLSSNNLFETRINSSFSFTTSFNLVYDSTPVDNPQVANINYRLSNGISLRL